MSIDADADRLLLRTARHGGGWLVLLGCAALARATAQVLLPAATGRAVDVILTGGSKRWLLSCVVLVTVAVITEGAVQLAAGTASADATAWLRRLLAGHILGCGPRLSQFFSTGDTVSRVVGGTSDAGAAPASVVLAIVAVIPPIASVVALGLISPWLMAAFAVGFPALAVLLRGFVRDSSDVSTDYQRVQGMIAARLLDALTGARTIAAAGTQEQERRRILAPLPALRGHGDASWRIQARAASQAMVIVPAMQVIVLAVAGVQLARHQIQAGDLVAASQYAVLAVGIGATIGQVNRLARARGGSRRAAALLARPRMDHGTTAPPRGPGRLRLRSVTVRHDGATVLRGLDLTVPGGASVAVVGRSGSGKSTLASVAGRLCDPDAGEVTLDGIDLRHLTHDALREAVVYAFERPELFGETPLAAIGFGASTPSREQVMSAARASHAAPFLTRLPGGMRARLERFPMSGGEIQRLGLARAFAHADRARLLILDDATSSLDTATEMLISRVLAEQLSDRTRLVVAHRATTASRADLVVWLDDGRVRAMAPHRELWADAEYRAIFAAETGETAC